MITPTKRERAALRVMLRAAHSFLLMCSEQGDKPGLYHLSDLHKMHKIARKYVAKQYKDSYWSDPDIMKVKPFTE